MNDVGVVIATCDSGDTLLGTLARLTALPERPPILVVDNGAPSDLAAAVRAAGHRPPVVEVVTLPGDHGPAARTVGARRLSTELVAFCDNDSWFAPGALDRAAERFARDPRLALLQARVLVGPEERLDPTCALATGAPALLRFVACGAVLRRRALLEVGGFRAPRGSAARSARSRSTSRPPAGSWPTTRRWSPITIRGRRAGAPAVPGAPCVTTCGRRGRGCRGGSPSP
jgi:GT2 family glycosyltransferase